MLTELVRDSLGSTAGQHGRHVHSRVERGGVLDEWLQRLEPFAQPRTLGIRIEHQVGAGLLCRLNGALPCARAAHAVRVRRAADHDEVGTLDQRPVGLIDRNDNHLPT